MYRFNTVPILLPLQPNGKIMPERINPSFVTNSSFVTNQSSNQSSIESPFAISPPTAVNPPGGSGGASSRTGSSRSFIQSSSVPVPVSTRSSKIWEFIIPPHLLNSLLVRHYIILDNNGQMTIVQYQPLERWRIACKTEGGKLYILSKNGCYVRELRTPSKITFNPHYKNSEPRVRVHF